MLNPFMITQQYNMLPAAFTVYLKRRAEGCGCDPEYINFSTFHSPSIVDAAEGRNFTVSCKKCKEYEVISISDSQLDLDKLEPFVVTFFKKHNHKPENILRYPENKSGRKFREENNG